MRNRNLFEGSQWTQTKRVFTEGLNAKQKRVMDIVLENTRKDLKKRAMITENATSGSTASGNIAILPKVILPVLRRVMPTVIANEIIGVQPMNGPVAQIQTLRVRYADTVPSDGSGVNAGAEALSPYDIARYYSGNENVNNPRGASTSVLEGVAGNRINVEIVKQTVEAVSRKLSARWNFEASQDAQSQYAIDIEAEIMSAIAQEIVAELDQEILSSLRALPVSAETYDQANLSGVATFVGDEHAALASLMNIQANRVAARTRRGAANWAVVSQVALTILQSATTSAFARTTEGTFEAPTNTKFAGVLNNSMRIYTDQYANDSTPVLVGYKGDNEVDAAAYYCPYVPLTSTGVVIDPQTFEPVISFMTRYGYVELNNASASFGNSADYLGLINIVANSLRFS